MSFYNYKLDLPNGEVFDTSTLKGKVVLVVNTATGCGFTPHYKPIEEMYEEFKDKGFFVIDVPCNQFAGQTPGTDQDIHEFCLLKYNTKFPQMKKSDVNGPNELPLFSFLKSEKSFAGFGRGPKAIAMGLMLKKLDSNYKNNSDIKWKNICNKIIKKNNSLILS